MEDLMKVFRVIFMLMVAALIFVVPISGNERMVVRIENPDESTVNKFVDKPYDIAAYSPGQYLDIVVNFKELADLNAEGYYPVITQTEERIKNNLQTKTRTLDGYRNYTDILAELNMVAEEFPEIARLYDIGDSWGKIYTENGNNYYQNYYFDIWALKLTANPDSLSDKPAVFFFGTHHAREPLSAEVVMDFLQLLLSEYGVDDEITFLIDNTEIWFVPLVNPDGHNIVLSQRDVWWRKNIRDNNANGRFDTSNYYGNGNDGVDLNRNYPFEWRYDSRINRTTYPGPEAGSEPEVSAILDLFEEAHFVAGITYHTYGEMVLYPYGYAYGCRAPDHDALSTLSKEMATVIPKYESEGHYIYQQSLELYPARGVTDDEAYGEHGVFCLTIELATEFIPSIDAVRQISSDNMEAAKVLLRRIHRSTLTGLVTDIETGEPVVAEVFIAEIDETGSFRQPYVSREPFGRYYRILDPGEYEVVYRSEKYSDSHPYIVTITEDEQTVLDVGLYPLRTGKMTGTVVSSPDHEPIAGAKIELIGSTIEPVFTDEDGNFFVDEIYYRPYTVRITAENYGTIHHQVVILEPLTHIDSELFPPLNVDTFDSLDNWETTETWGLSTLYTYAGDYSLADSPNGNYSNETVSYVMLKEKIDLTDAYNASITFMATYGLEDSFDFCYVQVKSESQDNQNDWTNIETITGCTEWELIDISLADYCEEIISVRFLFVSDQNIVDTGIYIDDFRIYVSVPESTGVEDEEIPVALVLNQNYPNPFNPETTISFDLPVRQEVKLEIFNIAGQKIRTLLDTSLKAGSYTVVWNGENDQQKQLGSGVYVYRLSNDKEAVMRKMILLK